MRLNLLSKTRIHGVDAAAPAALGIAGTHGARQPRAAPDTALRRYGQVNGIVRHLKENLFKQFKA